MRLSRTLLLLAPLAALASPALLSQGHHGPHGPHGPHRHHGGRMAENALFRTAESCGTCHDGLVTPEGEDVSLAARWRASMMANSSRDPYWQAAVRREVLDHPAAAAAIEDECSICHMPMTTFSARAAGARGEVFRHLPIGQSRDSAETLAADGTSCTVCHQVAADRFGERASFTGGYVIDTSGRRHVYGPYAVDAGRARIMRSASGFVPYESRHVQASELCATCHTLFTHALGPAGESLDELPEQVPYLEWRHSAFPASHSCQACHMPEVRAAMPISTVWGQDRTGFSRHGFHGGNFFVPRLLARYARELGVAAPPGDLEEAARETSARLQVESAAVSIERVTIGDGRLMADVRVENLAGHKLPTGYPSRRTWLHVTVRDAAGAVVFESGAFDGGRIAGNDNDADATRWERHYREIDDPSQVQVYESVMVDRAAVPTTGLLTGVRYVKDNRLLPRGFDKVTAPRDVAVRGEATGDADFTGGGDTVRYRVALGAAHGPFTVEAQLWYQPIAWRWAQNLRQRPAVETDRFVGYYEAMAAESALVLAKAARRIAIQAAGN
jgi:hypothetical protein